MRLFIHAALICLLVSLPAVAQKQDNMEVLKLFTRTSQEDGVDLNLVHLNPKTVDLLFEAPGKYSVRARANMATLFYIQGVPNRDLTLNTAFVLTQGPQTVKGTPQNIKYFQNGAAVKGQRIDGIVEFPGKIDVTREFSVTHGQSVVKFKLSPEALKLLEPSAPAAAAPAQN